MQIIFILLAFTSISIADFAMLMPPSYVKTPLGDSIDVATMKILKGAYDSSTDRNIVTSPLGLMMILSLYNLGAGPNASSEITKLLGGTDAEQVSKSFEHLSLRFSFMNSEYLSIANKISVSDKYTLDEKFAAVAREYRCEFDKLNFSNPDEAAAKINKWASEKTKGHITSPVSKEKLIPEPAAALFNVMFFNGHWHVPFKAEETKDKDFHVSRETLVKKPMMHLLKPLYYKESTELGAKMIELPYKEPGFRMVVILPDKVDGLSSVLDKAATKGLLSDVFSLGQGVWDIDLDMPKFDIRTKLHFNDILPKVGVKQIFQESATGIVNVPVKVSKIFQEAFIKVNEEGATAGAFIGYVEIPYSRLSKPPPSMKFTVDHPFLYVILYEDKIIFAGTYSE